MTKNYHIKMSSMVIPTLIVQTLFADVGVNDVRNSLQGSSSLSFSISTQKVLGDEYDAIYGFLTNIYGLKDKYAFVIRDTAITSSNSADVAEYFSKLLNINDTGNYTYDVCFLGKFLDNCNQYSDEKNIGLSSNSNGSTDTVVETGAYLARTTGARGIEAILFSPSGIKKFLSDITKYPSFNETMYYAVHGVGNNDGVLRAVSFTPSLYNFNPQYITSMNDYVKTSECANVKTVSNPTPTTGNILQFFIFMIVVVLILVGVYFLFKITPQPNY
jgi:hypothetical protein